MTGELILYPKSEGLRANTDDDPAWRQYGAELSGVINRIANACEVGEFEVQDLLVNWPLKGRYAQLRNGVRLDVAQTVALVTNMAAGWFGPYCALVAGDSVRLQPGFDAAMHIYVPDVVGSQLASSLRLDVSAVEWSSPAVPDPAGEPVMGVADDQFWKDAESLSGRLLLLRERWAWGSAGSRWFRLEGESTELIRGDVQARSLVSIYVDPPVVRVHSEAMSSETPARIDCDFTAFVDLEPIGELVHRAFSGATTGEGDVQRAGFNWILPEDEFLDPGAHQVARAVVPDRDGVARALWEGA